MPQVIDMFEEQTSHCSNAEMLEWPQQENAAFSLHSCRAHVFIHICWQNRFSCSIVHGFPPELVSSCKVRRIDLSMQF